MLAAQAPQIDSVLNDASQIRNFSPGVRVIINGRNFGPARSSSNSAPPGLTVTVNQQPAEILGSSDTFIRARFPIDLPTGSTNVVVSYQGSSSPGFFLSINAYAPGLYPPSSTQFLNLTHPQQINSASPGDLVSILAVGLGATNPPAPFGSSFTLFNGPPTVAAPLVTLGGKNLTLISSTFYTGGLYAVQVRVPLNFVAGDYPVILRIQGFNSNTVPFSVRLFGIVPTQSGLTFSTVQGGGAPPARSFQVLNGTTAALNLAISASTISGGDWLAISTTQAVADPAKPPPSITATVNPSGLGPGDYYGQIRVDAPGAPNTPQVVSVVLNVSGANANPGPVTDATGLLFVSVIGSPAPAAQAIHITTLTNRASAFTATGKVASGPLWFNISPTSGSVVPGQPFTVQVTPAPSGLAAGVYTGTLILQFPSDNVTRTVDLVLIVTSTLNAASAAQEISPAAAPPTCQASKLVLVFTQLGNGFSTPASWPTPIEVRIFDDCGGPLTGGTVTAAFSNGDPPLSLLSSQDGGWFATWVPRTPLASGLKIHIDASEVAPALAGSAEITGAVQANPNVPVLNLGGVVSAASFAAGGTPSPGEIVSIFGASLADGKGSATSLPFPPSLLGATLLIGGQSVPLVSASDGQINAVLPYTLATNTTVQLIAQHGNRLSTPIPVSIASADPGIFTIDQSGKGQGHIYVVDAGGQYLADSSHPAKAGDYLQIYASGLGAVDPPVEAGTATPDNPLRQVTGVGLTIGGQPATIKFAGLTPGSAGLYQVNAVVPDGVGNGEVQVVLSVAGTAAPPVTMVVRQP